MYEHFDHTADLGLRVQAATLEELLAEAARGLLAMHVANPAAIRPTQSKTIELAADDPPYLLFDWLSELLYTFESEKLLLCEFDIQLSQREGEASAEPSGVRKLPDGYAPAEMESHHEAHASRSPMQLRATCRGEPMDETRHTMDHEVKAITYHALQVHRHDNGTWLAEVIVDI